MYVYVSKFILVDITVYTVNPVPYMHTYTFNYILPYISPIHVL